LSAKACASRSTSRPSATRTADGARGQVIPIAPTGERSADTVMFGQPIEATAGSDPTSGAPPPFSLAVADAVAGDYPRSSRTSMVGAPGRGRARSTGVQASKRPSTRRRGLAHDQVQTYPRGGVVPLIAAALVVERRLRRPEVNAIPTGILPLRTPSAGGTVDALHALRPCLGERLRRRPGRRDN
jgi:hypothetical protein